MTSSSSSTTGPARTDLAQRTQKFAKSVRSFVARTPRTFAMLGDCRNLLKSSGYLGAAYIDADEAGSRQSFVLHMRDCCRQARQASHWLQLLDLNLEDRSEVMRKDLLDEAGQLEKIFGAIVAKTLANAKEKEAAKA